MEVKTLDFGTVTVEDRAVYTFPEGVYGFESCKEFALFQQEVAEDLDLLYLQYTGDTYPCFLIFEPWDLYEGYDPKMTAEDLKACEAETEDDLVFISIAKMPSDITRLSLNMKSPIALNPKTRKGKQVILENPDYEMRYCPFANVSLPKKEEE